MFAHGPTIEPVIALVMPPVDGVPDSGGSREALLGLRAGAAHLRAELEAQLTCQQVEAAHLRVQAKAFETAVDEVLKRADLAKSRPTK